MSRGIFRTIIKRTNNDWHWNRSPWPWGKTRGPNSAGSIQRQGRWCWAEGSVSASPCWRDAAPKCLCQCPWRISEHLGTLQSLQHCPSPPGAPRGCRCKSRNSAFNIAILNVTDFPFSARWFDLIEARSRAGFPAFQMIFSIKHANPTARSPCFCGIMSAERCHERWHLFTETQGNIFCRMRFLTKASLWHELLNCLRRVLI